MTCDLRWPKKLPRKESNVGDPRHIIIPTSADPDINAGPWGVKLEGQIESTLF